jgi:hypothetical protein
MLLGAGRAPRDWRAVPRVVGNETRTEETMEREHDHPEEGTETAEGEEAGELSERLPEEVSGEGDTPLGDTDEHSDAPGPHGTGPLNE